MKNGWDPWTRWTILLAIAFGLVCIAISTRSLVQHDVDLSAQNKAKLDNIHDHVNDLDSRMKRIEEKGQ